MFCMICYDLYDLKNVKITQVRVLLLVKLQVSARNFTKSNAPPWVFFYVFLILTVVPNCAKRLTCLCTLPKKITGWLYIEKCNVAGLGCDFIFLSQKVSLSFTINYKLHRSMHSLRSTPTQWYVNRVE